MNSNAMQNAEAYIMAVRGRSSIKPTATSPLLTKTQVWMKTTREIAKDHRKQKAAAEVAETKAKSDAKRKLAADAVAARRTGRDTDKVANEELAKSRAHVHPEAELSAAEAEAGHHREKVAAARAIHPSRKYPILDPTRLKAAKANVRQFRRQSDRDRASFMLYHSAEENSMMENDLLQHLKTFL